MEYEIKEGKGNIKEYKYTGELRFEGEYLNGTIINQTYGLNVVRSVGALW